MLTFYFNLEYLTAQTREPDIRINTDSFIDVLGGLQFSAGGDFLYLFFYNFIWRYNVIQPGDSIRKVPWGLQGVATSCAHLGR